jgi:hypothetical protein
MSGVSSSYQIGAEARVIRGRRPGGCEDEPNELPGQPAEVDNGWGRDPAEVEGDKS